jgi:hypothetical protein
MVSKPETDGRSCRSLLAIAHFPELISFISSPHKPYSRICINNVFSSVPQPWKFLHSKHFPTKIPQVIIVSITLTMRPVQSNLADFIYLSMALQPLVDLGRFFSFLILYTIGRISWTGDQSAARPLPTPRITRTQNKRTQISMPRVGLEPTIPLF